MSRHTRFVLFLILTSMLVLPAGYAEHVVAMSRYTSPFADFTPRDLDVDIEGSGDRSAEPLYDQFIVDYGSIAGKVDVSYDGVPSKEGIENVQHNSYEFAGIDNVEAFDDLDEDRYLYVPLVMAPVVITYHKESLKLGNYTLKFSGDTLAKIFKGDVTTWNDEAIANDNPNLTEELPDTEIVVVYRSDSAGVSSVLTTYLDKIRPNDFDPTDEYTPNAPKREGVDSETKMASRINATNGAIGYVTYHYARSKNLPMSSIRNTSSQKWIRPTLASTAWAASGISYPDNPRMDITNSAEEYAYPLAAFIWVVVKRYDYGTLEHAEAVTDFVYWMLDEPQWLRTIEEGYVPLSDDGKRKAIELLEKVEFNDERVFQRP